MYRLFNRFASMPPIWEMKGIFLQEPGLRACNVLRDAPTRQMRCLLYLRNFIFAVKYHAGLLPRPP